jgi:hypothetical protein
MDRINEICFGPHLSVTSTAECWNRKLHAALVVSVSESLAWMLIVRASVLAAVVLGLGLPHAGFAWWCWGAGRIAPHLHRWMVLLCLLNLVRR